MTLQQDSHVFTFTRTSHREWRCDVQGCTHVMGLKQKKLNGVVVIDEDGKEVMLPNPHGIGRQQFLAHAQVRRSRAHEPPRARI